MVCGWMAWSGLLAVLVVKCVVGEFSLTVFLLLRGLAEVIDRTLVSTHTNMIPGYNARKNTSYVLVRA